MANRTGNYAAFYVDEPFSETNLGAFATRDFVTYSQLRAWKGMDSAFPFVDSHNKNYNVRDTSDWERTLKPRLRDRLNMSKNIVLILSSITVQSKALKEEIDWGINTCGLPVIIIYPEYSNESDVANLQTKTLKKNIQDLWGRLPILRDSFSKVPVFHVPNNKSAIEKALSNPHFVVSTKCDPGHFILPC